MGFACLAVRAVGYRCTGELVGPEGVSSLGVMLMAFDMDWWLAVLFMPFAGVVLGVVGLSVIGIGFALLSRWARG